MNHAQLVEKLTRIKLLADECLRDLAVSQRQQRVGAVPTAKVKSVHVTSDLDFTLPIRPFIKKYAAGLSGPKKFTLLLARLVERDLQKEISLLEVEKAWNGMTSLMGGMKFNRFYSQQAKDNGWVDTKKKGMYTLRPTWKEIISHA
jgi:hypothetical protein